MADQGREHRPLEDVKCFLPERSPSASKALAVATLVPLGGLLLTLAGLILFGSFVGLTVLAPLFLVFSPVLVPAATLLGLAVAGFLTSGAFGLTGVAATGNLLRQVHVMVGRAPEEVNQVKGRAAEAGGELEQETKRREAAPALQGKEEEKKGN